MTPPKLPSTTDGDNAFMRGRLEKAKGFLESAETLSVEKLTEPIRSAARHHELGA